MNDISELWVAAKPDPLADDLARRWVDLAQPRMGTQAIFASDDFFAPKERLIDPRPPIFVPGKYDDNGKWMDGWESRRKRVPGHDSCIVRLGCPGIIHAVDIDTSHFTGNYPPEASIDAWRGDGDPDDTATWQPLVGRRKLAGDSHHIVDVTDDGIWSHLRLNIFPDGGVARLRVFGEVHKDWSAVAAEDVLDLAALTNGARALAWNDAHFGTPQNMLAPGPAVNMGDGWETRRRRTPGNDWAIIALAHPGVIERIVVDTDHFKGNYPDRCSLQGATVGEDQLTTLAEASGNWPEILQPQKLGADRAHEFISGIVEHRALTHVRLNIFPDGGVARLRLFGRIER